MRKFPILLILFLIIVSCNRSQPENRIISVSIGPFKYFVQEIAGDKFFVNVMVPAGSNPHVYEPVPDQIAKLGRSVAYISDGFLGFEMAWLDRFYEINKKMKKLSLSESIDPIESEEHHDDHGYTEGADPHYWASPACAMKMASSVKSFLIQLDPENIKVYEDNYAKLMIKIGRVDSLARSLSDLPGKRPFLIYHPNLAYLARDYGLQEIAVENEGKEPSPSGLQELIDRVKSERINVIMIQKEYDIRYAKVVSDETGAEVVVIDPLSEDWYSSEINIINIIKDSFNTSVN